MGALVPFVFEGRELRAFDRDGEPWFVAGDASSFLSHATAKDLTRSLDDDEKGRHTVPTPGGEQEVLIISEAGLYRAIAQRRTTAAIPAETREFITRFQRWVFHDVLPEIRRTGSYQPQAALALPDFSNPAAAARAWAEQYEARAVAERTKAEIGSRREATAMNTASQAVKRASQLAIELDRSREYATVKRMQLLYHGQQFAWRMLKHVSAEMGITPIEVFDANYGTVKAYHADVWREAYALEITPAEVGQREGASL